MVHPEHQGKGLGKRLLTAIEKEFQLSYDRLKVISQTIAECFKSESLIEKIDISEIMGTIVNRSLKYETPYFGHFSKKHNAFDELYSGK